MIFIQQVHFLVQIKLPPFGRRPFPKQFEQQMRLKCNIPPPSSMIKVLSSGRKSQKYIEISAVIQQLNNIFTNKGWKDEVLSLELINQEERNGNIIITYSAKVRITLQNGVSHEDIGVATGIRGINNKEEATESAIKSAITDGIKRCAKKFGPAFGSDIENKVKREQALWFYDQQDEDQQVQQQPQQPQQFQQQVQQSEQQQQTKYSMKQQEPQQIFENKNETVDQQKISKQQKQQQKVQKEEAQQQKKQKESEQINFDDI